MQARVQARGVERLPAVRAAPSIPHHVTIPHDHRSHVSLPPSATRQARRCSRTTGGARSRSGPPRSSSSSSCSSCTQQQQQQQQRQQQQHSASRPHHAAMARCMQACKRDSQHRPMKQRQSLCRGARSTSSSISSGFRGSISSQHSAISTLA